MKKNLVTSLMIITFFNGIDRVLGFLFKIYLSLELTAGGIGIYQVAMSIFFVLLTFITSGIPLVVSKKTAKYKSLNDKKAMGGVTSAALIISVTSAFVLISFVLIFYKPLSNAMSSSNAMELLLYLLPALVFAAIYSSLRGNLWGKEKYFAVAIVEVIEQVSRIACCVTLFVCGFDKLISACISLTVGCFVSAVSCAIFFIYHKGKLYSPKGHIRTLFLSELPITLSKSANSLVSSLLAIAVPFLLMLSEIPKETAYEMFGASSGMAFPLLFTPMTIIGSLAFVLIPTIGASANDNRLDSVNRQIVSALGFSAMVACFFIPLFSECGEKIGQIVYQNELSGRVLSMSAWILLPISIEAISSSIMNSLDLEIKSFINCMIGYVVQGVVYLIFCKSFSLFAYVLGMGLSLSVATILHILCITKKTGLPKTYIPPILKCVLFVLPCGFLTNSMLGLLSSLPELLCVVLAGASGMLLFMILSILINVINIDAFVMKFTRKRRKIVLKI